MAAPTSEVAAAEAAAPVCNGKYKGGLAPSAAELEEILNKHAAWLNDGGPYNHKLADDPRKANLCEASLSGAHLEGKDLTKADLTKADLNKAFLWART